jgi:hypothetical protein
MMHPYGAFGVASPMQIDDFRPNICGTTFHIILFPLAIWALLAKKESGLALKGPTVVDEEVPHMFHTYLPPQNVRAPPLKARSVPYLELPLKRAYRGEQKYGTQ